LSHGAGFTPIETLEVQLAAGGKLPVVRMGKSI
jgi:hypothetical protein